VPVPKHREIKRGLLIEFISEAGLTKGELLELTKIFHNYIRPHEVLGGKTPSEACGIAIEGKDKWLTLIQNATDKL
jgi:hypothetical protein